MRIKTDCASKVPGTEDVLNSFRNNCISTTCQVDGGADSRSITGRGWRPGNRKVIILPRSLTDACAPGPLPWLSFKHLVCGETGDLATSLSYSKYSISIWHLHWRQGGWKRETRNKLNKKISVGSDERPKENDTQEWEREGSGRERLGKIKDLGGSRWLSWGGDTGEPGEGEGEARRIWAMQEPNNRIP